MDFLTALEASAFGLAAQRTRVNLAASNLANAETTRGPDGKPYHRLDPVFEPQTFASQLGEASGQPGAVGVKVANVVADMGPGRKVFSPGHPDADANGFVTFPDVNPVHEVVNLMSAESGYQANATAIETLKTMAQKALDI